MLRPVSTPPDLPGYDFIKTLGSGGFSDVFQYEQRLPRRMVAVKVLLTEQVDQSTRARFVAEANLMAQLSTHPYIVTIYHADVAGDGRPYFVMEYCSGPSLADRYKRESFSVEDALRTGVKLAGAIATAHGAGILHRDIKPANVLTNDFGWPALTDFGISSTLEDDLPVATTTGPGTALRVAEVTGSSESQSVGMSVPWSPAEMFEDDPKPDVRSDVFSLAATIHTLLAGQTPFEIRGRSNGTLDLIGRIERGAVTPIERDDVPGSLTAVLQKGMATRRADRYASAVDFARALQRIELELGYSPTGIDVPSLRVEHQRRNDAPAGEDETRARSVRTIPAQGAPVQRPLGTPSSTTPAGNSDKTRVRGAVAIDARAPAQSVKSPTAAPEETVIRGRSPEQTEVRSRRREVRTDAGAPARATASAGQPEPAGTNRRRGIGISVAAGLVVVGAIAAALTLSGGPAPKLAPTRTPIAATDDAVVVAGVPSPLPEGTATSVDGTVVTFTISNPDPRNGDVYRWARSEAPDQPKLSKTLDIAVDGVTPGEKVCIDVYLQRSDGKLSEASTVCNR
jgi:serine/threonine protein kinase